MDLRPLRPAFLLSLASLLVGCTAKAPVESLPSSAETMLRVSRRLGESLSLKELARFDRRGDLVLAALTSDERHALGRNHVRFRVDRRAVVTVAAPAGSEPFWLADQGFSRRTRTLRNEFATYTLHARSYPPGWVGLGVIGLDTTSPAPYAVFLQDDAGRSLRPAETVPGGLECLDPSDPRIPFASLPADLSESNLLTTRHADRHATALVTGRVWKTHQPSLPTPDQVVVSTGTDAASSLAWNWRTRPETTETIVRLAPDSADAGRPDPDRVRTIYGQSVTVSSFGLLNDPIVRRHGAELAGLDPATTYLYSVGDGTDAGSSPWHRVRTGPKAGGDYRLMYLGDAQCGLEGWGKLVADAIERHPDVGAILMAGDLVDRGNERSNWDHFFLRAAGVFERTPVLPAVGNHEYLDRGPVHYRASFTLPANGPEGIDPGLVYHCEYGDTFLAVLDSNLAKYDPNLAQVQARWLDEALSKTKATWRLVMFHHPIYASHPTRENPEIGAAWLPVFDRHRVDLVLQGHDHAYLRSYPMRGGRRVDSPSEGTTYLVTVSGDKYVDQAPRDYAAVGMTGISTYQLLDISPARKTLLYRAFDATGKELDRLELNKAPASADRAIADRRSVRLQ